MLHAALAINSKASTAQTSKRILSSPQMIGAASAARQMEIPDAFQQLGKEFHIARNQTIFSEGEISTHYYKITSGSARLCKHMPDGRRQIVDFLFPGDFFGFTQMGSNYFTAETITDVVVIRFQQNQIEHLCDERLLVHQQYSALLSKHFMGLQNHLVILGRQNAMERVAAFLLLLQERLGRTNDLLDLPMGRLDIADYLGLTNETVCRVLTKLKNKKLIKALSLHQILLVNKSALRALAEGDI